MASGSFVSRHPILSILILLLLLFIGYVAKILLDDQPPIIPYNETFSVSETKMIQDNITARVSLKVKNRLPFPVWADSIRYTIVLNDFTLLQGIHKEKVSIGPLAEEVVSVPLQANQAGLIRGIRQFEGENVAAKVQAIAYTSLFFVGPFTKSVAYERAIQIPALPKVEVAEIVSDSLDKKGGLLQVKLRVQNVSPFPVDVKGFSYQFRVATVELSDSIALNYDMRRKGEQIVTVPIRISYEQLGQAAMQLLFQPEKATYQLQGLLQLQTDHPAFRKLELPIEDSGSATEIIKGLGR